MSKRNRERVYWVNCDGDDMTLLRGNELMQTDYFGEVGSDQDWLDAAWEDNAFMIAQDEEGPSMRTITDAEAEKLFKARQKNG